MKANQIGRQGPKMPLQEVQPKEPCIVCQKPVSAPYGVFREGWVCSRKCNDYFEKENRILKDADL